MAKKKENETSGAFQTPKTQKERKPLRMGTGWFRVTKGVLSVPWMILKILLGVLGTVLLIALVTGTIFACSLANYLQEDVIPNSAIADDPMNVPQTSFIYATDRETGEVTLLQRLYAEVDRQWVSYDDIPDDLVNAAIAIEDKRFREHSGVDWFRTGSACIKMFLGGSSEFGGSTITQQYVKNDTGEDDVTVRRKVKEIFRALQYEKTHTKEQIMENYLNTIYLGENCYGVRSAARVYFGKEVSDLTAAECASLISITNNPSLYDPYISQNNNRKRQLTVLQEMKNQGYLTDEEYREAVNQEMVFRNTSGAEQVTCPSCGYTGFSDEFEYNSDTGRRTCPSCGDTFELASDSQEGYSYFVDAVYTDVAEDLQEKYGCDAKTALHMVQSGGYHIYATIDLDVQAKIDEIYQNLSNVPNTWSDQQLQSAIVVIDNETGDIVGLAGGVGKKTGYLEWSRATDSTLQTGSSIKPLSVYAPAIDMGVVNPATIIKDGPVYDDYPQNYYRTYSGYTSILEGVCQSLNAVSAQTLMKIGFEQSFHYAKDLFGLSTLVEEAERSDGSVYSDKALAPLAMGALSDGARVSDMASAFASFPNGGVWREGRLYTKVYDSQGNLILDNTQDSHVAVSEKTANYMNYILSYTTDNTYTGSIASISGMNVAGKTGTTTDDKDRWYCGYTPYYTAAVWCGYDDPEEIVLDDPSDNPAAEMWNKVMTRLVSGKENKSLYSTNGMVYVSLCRDSGKYATELCKKDVRGSRVLSAYVYADDVESLGQCDKHVEIDYCEEGKAIANEYCDKFKDNKVTKKSMVVYTEEELKYLQEECKITLPDNLYITNKDAKKTCTVHTKEKLEEQNKPTEPATKPTEPTAPTETTAPTEAQG